MEIIQKISKIIYSKDNFLICASDEGIVLKGPINEDDPRALLDTKIKFHGKWVEYKGEQQFNFEYYELLEEQNLEYFFKNYLGSGMPSYIKKIMDVYTLEEIQEALETDNLDMFLNIKGIGQKTVEKIRRKYKLYMYNKVLVQCLMPYGATLSLIKKIYDGFVKKHINEYDEDEFKGLSVSEDVCKKIKENPYILTKIDGIGFKKADFIALNMGIDEKSDLRLEAAVIFAMDEYIGNKGNTLVNSEELYETVKNALINQKSTYVLDKHRYSEIIEKMIMEDKIETFGGKENLTLKKYVKFEEFIFETFWNKMFSYSLDINESYINRELKKYEMVNDIKLDEKQVASVKDFLLSDEAISIISGYAGTGKTTIAKFIIQIFKTQFSEDGLVVCALAGSAANRIKVVTGVKNASTIHSLLGYKRTGNGFEFTYNESNRLDYKLVIVDESSMIDTHLFYSLLKAIDFRKTKVLIIGDPGQLPPVGAGAPFENIIELNSKVHKNRLTKIFRQDPLSVLTLFANKIRQGEVPDKYDEDYLDFEYKNFTPADYYKQKHKLEPKHFEVYKRNIKMNIANGIKEWFLNNRENLILMIENEEYKEYLQEFQVISPMRDKLLGIYHFNKMIQNILNAPKDVLANDRYKFAYDILIPLFDIIDTRTNEVKSYKRLKNIKDKTLNYNLKESSEIYDMIENNRISELSNFIKKVKRMYENGSDMIISRKEIFLEKDRVMHLSNKYMYVMSYEDYTMFEENELYHIIKETKNEEEPVVDEIYETRVYNGQSGIILKFLKDGNKNTIDYVSVYYPYEGIVVFYDYKDFFEGVIGLNYALTIHKSQGQEYRNVFIPISGQHFHMLNNKLLYTAITRAKEKCFIYAEDWAFKKACKNIDTAKRKTILEKMDEYLTQKGNENGND